MSRTAFAVACVLPVLLVLVVPFGCEPKADDRPATSTASPDTIASTTEPVGPAPELLVDAPPETQRPAPTSEPKSPPATSTTATDDPDPYEYRPGSEDGIDKWYMGRQIAHVVSGHRTIGWLERAEREQEERPSRLVEILKTRVEPDDLFADIGAGSGYYSVRIAPLVPKGKVLAQDIQQDMLDVVMRNAKSKQITNVETVLGTPTNPNLPADSVDYALLVDAYHEFDHPREMMVGLRKSLKPGGRVVLVEFRGEDASVPIKPVHKMTEAQAVKELEAAGLKHVETLKDLPWQHVMFFERPAESR